MWLWEKLFGRAVDWHVALGAVLTAFVTAAVCAEVIAATALEHGWPLVTANVDDFKWIPGIELIEPPLGLTEGA